MSENDDTYADFEEAVNMTAKELEDWLDNDKAKEVGQKKDGGESTGHRSGRKIVAILKASRSELSEDDYEHLRKVVSYVHRHRAQRPDGDITDTRWRYSLMNWGHDPNK